MTTLFTPIRLFLLAALAIVTIAGFVLVPAGTSLPVHWNIAGEADAFLPRELALLMPLAILAFAWVVTIVAIRSRPAAEQRAGGHIAQVVLTALTALFLAIATAIVAIGSGAAVNMVQLVALAVSVLLVVLGNAMPKSQPNSFAGLRIPTTLADPANWQATHRLGGVLTMGGGVILFAAALLLPSGQVAVWLLVCILVPLLVSAGYSMAIARHAR